MKEFSSLLSEMQTGNIDRSKEFTSNCHQRARRITRRADDFVSASALVFLKMLFKNPLFCFRGGGDMGK